MTQPTDLPADFDVALGAVGLTTSSARFNPGMMAYYRDGEFSLPLYHSLIDNPWGVPFTMEMHRRSLATSVSNPLETVSVIARLGDAASRRELLGDPIAQAKTRASQPDALRAALEQMRRQGLIAEEVPNLTSVPADVQKAAALVLDVALSSYRFRTAAFLDITDLPGAYSNALRPDGGYDPVVAMRERSLLRRVDRGYLAAGGQDLAAAVEQARLWAQIAPEASTYSIRIPTKWGDILLNGTGSQTYGGDPVLLVIDTAGNDTYVDVPNNRSADNWLSIAIDTQGNDQWVSAGVPLDSSLANWPGRRENRAVPGPGCAVYGYVFGTDVKGDDLYRSQKPSMGSASFGIAYIRDLEGNDTYDAYADSQGFARVGFGILEDNAGSDKYFGFQQVQGCGLTLGVGALIDRGGDDTYDANDEVIDFPSPQTTEHNVSMAQGAGNGVRRDYLGGDSLAGGVGLLYDVNGNDIYKCGVFGQGVGYWMSAGMLWDSGGNDRYTGQWYVQGAAAHFAVGALEDGNGRDTYTALLNMAQGAGHDFSLGVLVDWAGSDSYTAPNLSLGAGNANGIGIMVDGEGDDTYNSRGTTLGTVTESPLGTLREQAISLGVFLDLGGTDQFPAAAPWAIDGTRKANTVRKGNPLETGQYGIFWAR
ncbi:MAG: hypothetical protein KF812_10355 [Fimbriimonadaceae bacterium]|nr:hypothetical protein [Fimbriimonadaceae bacterium]